MPKRRARKRSVGSRISPDWTAPPIAELPLEVQAIVHRWPAGGYELTALAFLNHWLAEGRAIGAKRNWPRTWHNWLIRENTTMLRAKRAGAVFVTAGAAATPDQARRAEAELAWIERMQGGEDEPVRAIRGELRRQCGARTYDGWLRPTVITIDGRTVTVAAASQFMLDWIQQHFADRIGGLAAQRLGGPVEMRWELLRPPDAAAGSINEFRGRRAGRVQ